MKNIILGLLSRKLDRIQHHSKHMFANNDLKDRNIYICILSSFLDIYIRAFDKIVMWLFCRLPW